MDVAPKDKILFVCSGNTDRSPTAEWLYSRRPDIEPKSAGVDSNAKHKLERRDLEWADLVLVMESKQYCYIRETWRDWWEGNQDNIRVLGIADEYRYLQAELIDELEDKVEPKLERWRERQRPSSRRPPCVVCGDYRETQRAHFPKRARDEGTETIWLCPLHHRALDHGRIHRGEMEALMKTAFPNFRGTVEDFVKEQHSRGYPLTLTGATRNMRKRFWDAEPADPRFRGPASR